MDELFTLPLVSQQIAACHACCCNPRHLASYPDSWQTLPPGLKYYLNNGSLIPEPNESLLQLAAEIAAISDLSH